uniref:Uncharacterized protein n=1 Tax=Moniliophthora roreri TaxID=221103 RepID=A0A0W0FIH6_MONRR
MEDKKQATEATGSSADPAVNITPSNKQPDVRTAALPPAPTTPLQQLERKMEGSFNLKGKGKAPAGSSSLCGLSDSATTSGSHESSHATGSKPTSGVGNNDSNSDSDDNNNRKPSGSKINAQRKTKPLNLDDKPSSSQCEAKQKKKPGFLQVTKEMRKKWGLDNASTAEMNLALITHICILAKFFEEDVVPKPPVSDLISVFEKKFGTN